MLCRKKIDKGETIPVMNRSIDEIKQRKKDSEQSKGTDTCARSYVRVAKREFKEVTGGPTKKDPHDRDAGDREHKTIPDKLKK